jgi:hypothetical protein
MSKPKEPKEQKRKRLELALEDIDFPSNFSPIVKSAFHNYSGDFTVLESAIGAYFLGMLIGWRPLVIIHSPRTIKRYEKILSVKFMDVMEESTVFSNRSRGYEAAMLLSNFWSAVTGNASVEGRKTDLGLDGQLEESVS